MPELVAELAGPLGQGIRLPSWQENWKFDGGFFSALASFHIPKDDWFARVCVPSSAVLIPPPKPATYPGRQLHSFVQ